MAFEAVYINAIVMAMLGVFGRTMVGPIPWMQMSSRGIGLISLRGFNQGHLVIMLIGLMRLS